MSDRTTSGGEGLGSTPARSDRNPPTTDQRAAKLLSNSGLDGGPLRPGAAAKRLLEQDDAREMFLHESEPIGLFGRLRRYGWPTLRYLTQTEVHTYAFSVAANSLLSICPLIVLLLTIERRVFHSPQMYNVVLQLSARFSAQQPGLRDSQFAVPRQRAGARTSALAGDAAHHVHRNFSPIGSCSQQHLGIPKEPLLHHECAGFSIAGDCLCLVGAALCVF